MSCLIGGECRRAAHGPGVPRRRHQLMDGTPESQPNVCGDGGPCAEPRDKAHVSPDLSGKEQATSPSAELFKEQRMRSQPQQAMQQRTQKQIHDRLQEGRQQGSGEQGGPGQPTGGETRKSTQSKENPWPYSSSKGTKKGFGGVIRKRRPYVRRGSTEKAVKQRPRAIIEVEGEQDEGGESKLFVQTDTAYLSSKVEQATRGNTDSRDNRITSDSPFSAASLESEDSIASAPGRSQTAKMQEPQPTRQRRRLSLEEERSERKRMQDLLREHKSAQNIMMQQEQERRQRLSKQQQHARRLRRALDELDGESASRFVARALGTAKLAWQNRDSLAVIAKNQASLGWNSIQGDPTMNRVANIFTISAGISLFCLSWLLLLFILEALLLAFASFVGFALITSTLLLPALITVLVTVALLSGFVLLGMVANKAAAADNLH